jgi:hypothetical protein
MKVCFYSILFATFLNANGQQAFYNHSNGNVSIGTDISTGGKLQVADGTGDGTKYGTLQLVRPSAPGDNHFHLSFIRNGYSVSGMGYQNGSNVLGIWSGNNNSTTPLMSFNPSQRVGIATDNPKERFQIGSGFTFHDGGYKIIGANRYFDGASGLTRRINAGYAAAMMFTDNGSIAFATNDNGAAESQALERYPFFIRNDGLIGLGTADPQLPVHISRPDGYAAIGLGYNNINGFHITKETSDNSFNIWAGTYGSGANRFKINNQGKVGINNWQPEYQLDIGASGTNEGMRLRNNSGGFVLFHSNTMTAGAYNHLTAGGDAGIIYGTAEQAAPGTNAAMGFVIAPWFNGPAGLRMDKDGNVGIGTSQTSDANYNLFVQKGIRTRKVKVDQASWADYVFLPSYKLMTLPEVEAFIKKNGHLPEVPSEKEVAANGVDLGDTQTLLLKKIEELTLYMIELEKKNTELSQKVEALTLKSLTVK